MARFRVLLAGLALLVPAPGAAAPDEGPHRRIATDLFGGDPDLNSPLAALVSRPEDLKRMLEITRLAERLAEERGLVVSSADPELLREVARQLLRDRQDLLRDLPSLAEQAARAAQTGLAEEAPTDLTLSLERVDEIAKLLDTPFFREILARQIARAQSIQGRVQFRETVDRLRQYLVDSGVAQPTLDGVASFFRRVAGRGRDLAERFKDLAQGTMGSVRDFELPPALLAAAFAVSVATALVTVLFLRQRRARRDAPPPIPDFAALSPTAAAFTQALLAFYRRAFHDAGAPFQGRPITELAGVALRRVPEMEPDVARLNLAFHELWYGGAMKPAAAIGELNATLARVAAHALEERRQARA